MVNFLVDIYHLSGQIANYKGKTRPYGYICKEKNDVVGVLVDFTQRPGQISFYVNGVSALQKSTHQI